LQVIFRNIAPNPIKDTYFYPTSHIWISHGTHINTSCHTHEWVTCHTPMNHVTHMNPYVFFPHYWQQIPSPFVFTTDALFLQYWLHTRFFDIFTICTCSLLFARTLFYFPDSPHGCLEFWDVFCLQYWLILFPPIFTTDAFLPQYLLRASFWIWPESGCCPYSDFC